MDAYEVFRQTDEGDPLSHVGSVTAPDIELAVQYAREVYSRRNEAHRLWVVPREAVAEVAEHDFLQPPLDRTFRMGVAYRVTVAKRKELKERAKQEVPRE